MNRKHSITGHGGVQLCVHDLGPETAPAIILVHGWSQCHLSFARQAALAEGFRLILPDLRGHGQSDKPLGPACYDNSRPWAEDMQAIITSLALDAPLLVGWSMGGWVVMDYLEHFGLKNEIFEAPKHEYTRKLLSSIPRVKTGRELV